MEYRSQMGKDQREVVPEEDLDQHGRSAEEPDVEPAHARQDRIHREAHDGEEHAEGDADRHRDDRELERDEDPVEDRGEEEVLADDAPAQSWRGGKGVQHARGGREHDHRGDPSPRVAERDRLDGLRFARRGRGGVGDRHAGRSVTTARIPDRSCSAWTRASVRRHAARANRVVVVQRTAELGIAPSLTPQLLRSCL